MKCHSFDFCSEFELTKKKNENDFIVHLISATISTVHSAKVITSVPQRIMYFLTDKWSKTIGESVMIHTNLP